MAETITLVVNPRATRVTPNTHQQIARLLSPHGTVTQVTITSTLRAGDAGRAALQSGASLVVGVGGDGTISELAGALAGTSTALLPIAAGGTNVFARAAGWPHPAKEALTVIDQALAARVTRIMKLGIVETDEWTRTFCVNAGVGVDANTVRRVESHPRAKQLFRQLGFGVAAVAEAARAARRPACLTVSADDGAPVLLATIIVASGAPYAYLGKRPLDLVPGARFDGRLRWVGLDDAGPQQLVSAIRGALHDGAHLGQPGVHDGWATSHLTVEADHPVAIQADGEPLGTATHVTFRPGPEVSVLVPPST